MSIKIPGVLSFQRGTIVTDGTLASIVPRESEERLVPIKVIRHGIRGINNNPKDENSAHIANVQRTESAKTATDAIGLAVEFSFRTLPADHLLFGCSDPDYRRAVDGFIARFFVRGVREFDEVCLRYARNILNGRWLWRNRMLGDVSVEAKSGAFVYKGNGSHLNDFDDYTEDEKALAENVIASGFLSPPNSAAPVLNVEGRVTFGFTGEVEVFPSQNMVTNKPKGFARSLYKVDMISRKELVSILSGANKDGEDAGEFMADMIDMGRAALRDQKIGNAIRTIDTWYPDYAGIPIPVEPNGASLETNTLHRKPVAVNAKGLLSKIDEIVPSATFNPDAAYLIALIVRGGVFSEKSSEKSSEKA
jgi:CRISPR-associated protein Csy3